MASALSPSAIYRIVGFALSTGDNKAHSRGYSLHPLQQVDGAWHAVYKLYVNTDPAQPADYRDSLEVALVLKDKVDDEDVRAIFAQGKPMHFSSCPRLFVSKMVEAFRDLQEERTYLDVTLTTSFGLGAYSPSEVWPQVYNTQLPCSACTTVEIAETRRNSHPRPDVIPRYVWSAENDDFAVERFHVASERFRKQLTVELHYELEPTMTRGERAQASVAQMITIRLASETCSGKGSTCGPARRSSATLLLLPVFTTEIFGFLDRAHVGSSLLANRDLHDLICQLKRLLPVHHLNCAFEDAQARKKEKKPRGHARRTSPLWVSGIYLLPNCALYGVVYWPEVHRRTIELERKIVQICEALERGEITATVAHFKFNLFSSTGMHYAFKRDNLLVSGVKVEGKNDWEEVNYFEWDVYRFRNARTSEFLTACVGERRRFGTVECRLHIVKGEVYPDASFADY